MGSNSTASADYSVALGGATNNGRGAIVTGSGSVAIGTISSASGASAVALGIGSVADRDNTVSVGAGVPNIDGRTFTRQIVNVADGTEDNDAVNVGQMNAGLSTTNASIAATNAVLSTTNATLSTTNSSLSTTNATLSTANTQIASLNSGLSTANSNIDRHTADITTINDKLSELSNGTVGLVQQVASGDDITVGAATGGTAVNFAGSTGDRKLTGIAAGDVSTTSTEAINGSQLHGVSDSVASAIGGGATVKADGSISAPSFTVGDGSGGTKIVNSVGDVVTNLDGRVTTNEGAISKLADDIGSGTLGLVQQANAGDDITVGAATGGAAVNFAGSDGNRKLTGIAAGDVSATSTEAINGSQLHGVSDSVASAIGGGATVKADGSISAPSFTVGDGSGGTKIVNSVGDVVTNLDGRVTTNEGAISKLADDIGSGTLGLVQQANAGDDITIGAATGGAAVNFAGSAGNRKLTGIAAGDVSATSTEAINGSQLHGVSDSVASAIGGGATVKADGSISAPSFTVGDGSGGTKIVNSVGDVVTNLDGRVTTNEGAISKLADDIGSGTLGLVQQANPSGDITVGANSDGHAVNFSSKTGARTLTGVAAGDVSASSTDAVNGSQLHGVSDSVASAIGGGATVKADGSISAPSFTVGDGNGGTKIVNSVGDVVTNLDSRTTANEGDIKKLADDIGSGTLGLVQQANPSGDITVGANSDGHAVNFSSKTGARTLTGVAAGDVSAASADAVNGGQLHGVSNSVASALGGASTVGADGKLANVSFDINGTKYSTVEQAIQAAAAFGATDPLSVRYDLNGDGTPNFGSVTLGGIGAAPVVLTNVADGVNRYDAVNFGQLSALNDKFSDLDGRVGSLEQNAGGSGPGTPGDGSGTPGTGGPGSLVVGDGADASGANSSAIGQGAVASGENSTSLGQGASASGSNSSAVGQGAGASGENSTSLGQGASATGSGSVAIGQGSVATEANTVSFGNGTEEGNRRLVNIADGINASDAATKGQLDRAMESVDARFNDTNRAINDVAKNAYAGIAAAMAMPNMTPSAPGKTVVAVGTANFKSGSAIAAGATYRSRNGKWLVNGAASLTSVGDAGVRAQVGYEF
ncbi:YadA-like family protein [Burkholderia cenocepacia]|nr:YadA-like family protein [Burkholderia cenocepacia]MDS0801916.1 YadA-like family protein [Burkholderia cenocepacia]